MTDMLGHPVSVFRLHEYGRKGDRLCGRGLAGEIKSES